MNLFGSKKKVKEAKKAANPASGASAFNTVKVVSKPEVLNVLMQGLKEEQVEAEVSRQKLKAASLVSGRGAGILYNYMMHNFKSGPRPVVVISSPRSTKGGNFVPVDSPLEAGEMVEFSYSMALPQADGNTLYFTGRGPYLQTAIYIPNAEDPSKPWVASREATEKKMGEGGLKRGEEVLQVRVDQITVFPNAPESFTGDQIGPYVFSPELTLVSGGGVWAKRGGSGYFENIPDTLEKYFEKEAREERVKNITGITLVDFGVDTITMMINTDLFHGLEHDRLVPSVRKKPNDNLQVINSCVGFLLKFEVSDEVKELVMRTFPQKIGKEVEIYIPLILGSIQEAEPPKYRVVFGIFPRDLTQETDPRRRKTNPGVKFVPPFTLHPNPEDHNTYRKLMVAMGQRMKDDSRPDEEKAKLASVQAQVAQRREETKGKRVSENVKKAFSSRQEAKKRKEAQG
ncbi:MAG: hypothetical protein QGI83_25235 [Candidatus Latescibacteria bacterium]|jgi:hypothetical protein|nr:hypothetical protein [Candidatus Latescibacterota bacterium]